ncbi:cupin domain-containing protein [Flavobacterium algicola]|uniref:WxcM-like domain-containing protein n=1 Tax=Flavobacterium algicola TaxID=556529 RepID=UPI001EFD0423|nr:WxcM-like domain-containing protein [Flavobacterium algicola]MCG9793919.1 WxcM-like domain-containing protein [Flavobacterium algicola]
MSTKIIEGAKYSDDRGSVIFVNDFKFTDIERFYIIKNSIEKPIRAWQGHKLDSKNFFCITGSFKIAFVKIDNWENPSVDIIVESVVVKADEPRVLHIPAGYANAIVSLEENSQLMSFSTLPLDRVKEDDVRFDSNTWAINE